MIPCTQCGTPLRATPADLEQLTREHLNAYCRTCLATLDHGDG